MKIKIDRKVFAQALGEVAPFAPVKAPIAILKNAKFTTRGNRMKIEANDTQCSMVKYIELIESDQDGSFLIDIADLNKFVQKVKGDAVELEVDGNAAKVSHQKGTAVFQTDNADEFPVFKMPQTEARELTVLAELLSDAVHKGRNFVSTETLRPVLCPVYAYTEGNEFGFCATDTHKLITGTAQHNDSFEESIHWYIMPQVFSAIVNACKSSAEAKVSITDTHVQYTIGNARIQTVQAKGNYPNFKRVIPQSWSMECSVNKNELTEALGRVSLFCDNSSCVKIHVSPLDMSLSVDNLEYMKKSTEVLPHNGCNGELTIGVNATSLAACLSAFSGAEVVLKMDNESRPILFTSPDDLGLTSVVMPMALATN